MLSLFNPFALKRIWSNYDGEFCSYMLQQKHNTYQCYHYLDVVNLLSRSYFNSTNRELLKNLTTATISISDIDKIFSDQEQVSRLNDINQDLLKLLINKSIVLGYRGHYASVGFSLLALKTLWHNVFDLDQFCNQDQINQLNKIDCKSMELLLDKCSITKRCFSELLTNQIIDGLNSVNYDLFSALIDSIINQCNSKRYQELHRGSSFFDTSTFTEFLSFFLTQENVEKFNSISSNSLDALMSYATIPRGTRSYYLKNTIDEKDDPRESELSVIWSEFQDTLCIIKGFFNNLTKEKIENLNKLSSANPSLLKLFHNKGIIERGFLEIFKNETRFDNLNSIDVDLISTLIDGIINKLNLREADKLANENLNYGYNPVLSYLSEVFTIFDIKENAEKFNSMNPKSLNVLIDLAIREAIKMGSSYGSYEENDMNMFYTTKSYLTNTIECIKKFFNQTTQEQIEKLNSIDLDLLKVWIDKEIVNGSNDLSTLLRVINSVNLNLDSFTVFIDKGIIRNISNMSWVFNTKEDFDRLSSLDLDLLKNLLDNKLLDFSRASHKDGFGSLFGNREEFEKLRKTLDLEIFKTLVYEEVITNARDVDLLFGTKLDNSFQFWLNNQRRNFESRQLTMEIQRLENNILRIEQGLEEIHQNILDIPLELRERPEGFETINCDLLKILFNKNIILRNVQSIKLLFSSQEKIERFNSIDLDLLQILIDKKFIESSENLDELLNNTNFVTSAINNPSLTKTILNNDSLINALGTEGIIDLISHLKYAESSNYLLRNCKLALVLLSKGAIENITIDYLFNSTQIQSDVTEFLKDVELADAGDNITLSMDEVIDGVVDVVNDNPMPTLGDLSLTAFAKTLPSVGTRRT